MITTFADPFEALFNLQRALEGRLASDWLRDQTTSEGPYPPINVFQQGDDILAIIELPGVEKDSLQIQAKENAIRIAGKKPASYPDGVSVHRRERTFGELCPQQPPGRGGVVSALSGHELPRRPLFSRLHMISGMGSSRVSAEDCRSRCRAGRRYRVSQ